MSLCRPCTKRPPGALDYFTHDYSDLLRRLALAIHDFRAAGTVLAAMVNLGASGIDKGIAKQNTLDLVP